MTNEEIQAVVDAITQRKSAARSAVVSKGKALAMHYGLAGAIGAGVLFAIQHLL